MKTGLEVNKKCPKCDINYELFGVDQSGWKLYCNKCFDKIMVSSKEYNRIKQTRDKRGESWENLREKTRKESSAKQ